MKNNVLVLGGTGKTGRRIVERLNNLGHNVRIGSRGASPSFDWHNPAGWPAVLEGMEKVYITYQPDLAVPGAKEAITALTKVAQEKGVRKLVLLSGKGEVEAQHCEQIVLNSGIDTTIIRASWFNQNFSESFFLEPIQQGVVALPQAHLGAPYVDANDLADAAIEVLLNEGHNGQIYELTGPRLLNFKEITEIIAEATGRDLQFIPITLAEYVEAMKEMELPEDVIWLIEYLFTHVLDNPDNQLVTNDIEKLLGRRPVDFSEYVAETVKTGIWNKVVEV
ncbi:NmrA family transcriptional regulator [Allomuricauda sp. SCSIO 65647]|uniref:NmrA family transcriptional regulator n=1 Tax=Allomuricauda sp. SCSIO 65647 TaxID=2908843 RepID=UPI001F342685|nr:NmrA family transcriptional regulator [Muricauda sp. SCSIO 65647]UJH66443.1 NmrA family transcriptional regulator [Muricauda sp. SCSIO 65647]